MRVCVLVMFFVFVFVLRSVVCYCVVVSRIVFFPRCCPLVVHVCSRVCEYVCVCVLSHCVCSDGVCCL